MFRFVLPDLEQIARDYLASNSDQPARDFMKSAHLGGEARPQGPNGWLRECLGKNRHLWVWDYRSMRAELERTGFTEMRRAAFGDAKDVRFREVEDKERWYKSLGVESTMRLAG